MIIKFSKCTKPFLSVKVVSKIVFTTRHLDELIKIVIKMGGFCKFDLIAQSNWVDCRKLMVWLPTLAFIKTLLKVRKNTRKGGWIVFSKTFPSYEIKLLSGSESDRVQSLIWVQSLNVADRE